MRWEEREADVGWTFGVDIHRYSDAGRAVGYRKSMNHEPPDMWKILWLFFDGEDDEEFLPQADYTEDELREALILKYKLMGGKDE